MGQRQEEDFQEPRGWEKLQFQRRSSCWESIFGDRGEEATTRNERRTEEEREAKVGGCKEKVVGNRKEDERRVGAKKERKGREEEIGTRGNSRCNDRENCTYTVWGVRVANRWRRGWAGAALRTFSVDWADGWRNRHGVGTRATGPRHWHHAKRIQGCLIVSTTSKIITRPKQARRGYSPWWWSGDGCVQSVTKKDCIGTKKEAPRWSRITCTHRGKGDCVRC